jgi:hypothetical protein
MPRLLAVLIGVLSVAQAWAMAMYRDLERGHGLLDPLLHVFLGGFRLPALARLARMEAYSEYFAFGPSPLPLFALAGAILFVIWTVGPRHARS